MKSYNSVDEFEQDTLNNPLSFDFLNEDQENAYKFLKQTICENLLDKPPKARRFSMIFYGSRGIGKTFLINYVLKKLESEGKLNKNDYTYFPGSKFRNLISREHKRLMYDHYQIKVIDELVIKILKEYLYEKDQKFVIFDGLKEKDFLNIDFTAADFLYNCNGKGVIWGLSFTGGFFSNIEKKDIILLKINYLSRTHIEIIKDRHFNKFKLENSSKLKNIRELLNNLKKIKSEEII